MVHQQALEDAVYHVFGSITSPSADRSEVVLQTTVEVVRLRDRAAHEKRYRRVPRARARPPCGIRLFHRKRRAANEFRRSATSQNLYRAGRGSSPRVRVAATGTAALRRENGPQERCGTRTAKKA